MSICLHNVQLGSLQGHALWRIHSKTRLGLILVLIPTNRILRTEIIKTLFYKFSSIILIFIENVPCFIYDFQSETYL